MTNSRIIVALTMGVAAIAAFVFTWTEPPGDPWPNRSFAVDCTNPSQLSPRGGISVNELCNATIDLPDWRANTTCPQSTVSFAGGTTTVYGKVNETIDRVAYVDIDKDGNAETAVLISCGSQGSRRQVIVLESTGYSQFRALQQVVTTTYPVADIFDLVGTENGELKVQVGDYPGTASTASSRQWLSFRSNRHKLIRSDGTTLTGNPKVADFFVTTTDIVFHAPADGLRTGALTATVRNFGSSTVPFSLRLTLPLYAEVVNLPPTCTAVPTATDGLHVTCEIEGVATNGATQVELSLKAPENPNQVAVQTPPVLAAVLTLKDGYADLGISPKTINYSLRLE
ncbi:hypothetical protein Rhe02_91900 [Rhizocola hellebori]|uniref:Uncharacterized protein n=1 Tax=Rhizocola hellebori TaxID=1392758 RepID=A0A8J3QKL0_9ACTN|nr:hypothetical protein [Rhizocola hellebori]GIH11123.1 hypothetical protein Rhe02_91900 [Rhizocola hellebori]